jgi:hypothetical protein
MYRVVACPLCTGSTKEFAEPLPPTTSFAIATEDRLQIDVIWGPCCHFMHLLATRNLHFGATFATPHNNCMMENTSKIGCFKEGYMPVTMTGLLQRLYLTGLLMYKLL